MVSVGFYLPSIGEGSLHSLQMQPYVAAFSAINSNIVCVLILCDTSFTVNMRVITEAQKYGRSRKRGGGHSASGVPLREMDSAGGAVWLEWGQHVTSCVHARGAAPLAARRGGPLPILLSLFSVLCAAAPWVGRFS